MSEELKNARTLSDTTRLAEVTMIMITYMYPIVNNIRTCMMYVFNKLIALHETQILLESYLHLLNHQSRN